MTKATHDFRVLFIYPNTMMATLLPINISLLHACLRKAGFETRLFDTTFYHTEEINFEMKKVELLQIKRFDYADTGVRFKETDMLEDLDHLVDSYRPDLIAVTLVQDTFDLARRLIGRIRNRGIPTIAGGVFTTFSPDEVLAVDGIDFACIGEGEEALVELCRRLQAGTSTTGIPNIWAKTPGGIIKNPMRRPVDLDALPFIDYDIFEKERIYRPMQGRIYAMLHVELDRGCPYQCTYCASPELKRLYRECLNESYYRQKSVRRIIAEMKYLKEKYEANYIDFNSETFLARPIPDLEEFAALYKKEVGLPFWCQTRPETVSEEKIRIIRDMGCQNAQFGIECGNEAFRREILARNYSNEQILRAAHLLEEYGIAYTVNNIIGFPGETRELVFDTIRINRLIHPSTMNVYLFTPYRGTRLHQYCVEQGYLDADAEVHQLLDSTELKGQPLSYDELKGLQRTFPLYATFPESEYGRIERAERFDETGNAAFAELRAEFYERIFHMPYA
ncbi:MAG: B12-binding domain-containing radical SAM protein [Methanomicrobiales archaeon]|nr:B12-binding domain-containing radical SAM protein [Methanomicrobiales archaeon]